MKKPKCKIIEENGNVFNIISRVARALEFAGLRDKANEWKRRAIKAPSYDAVLNMMHEYVTVE